MFEQLQSSGPIGKLSGAIHRWRGIDQWPTAEATVYTCDWVDGGRGPSFYTVTFSYEAKGALQSGSYYERGSESSTPFRRGDTFQIRWKPNRPNRYYIDGSDNSGEILTVAMLGLVVLIILAWVIFLSLHR